MPKLWNLPGEINHEAKLIEDALFPPLTDTELDALRNEHIAMHGHTAVMDLKELVDEIVAKHGNTEAGFFALYDIVMNDDRLLDAAALLCFDDPSPMLRN
jgi:hypothetical protein